MSDKRDLLKRLASAGFFHLRDKAKHAIWVHDDGRVVSVPHGNKVQPELYRSTLVFIKHGRPNAQTLAQKGGMRCCSK